MLQMLMNMKRLNKDFFYRDVLDVAPELLGKYIVTKRNNTISEFLITEVEAYRGSEDLACHASKGRTPRTEIMYHEGGKIYVYLIYGMYWMLNFVTGEKDNPQAALIRGIKGYNGPGKLTKKLEVNRSFYAEDLNTSKRIWLVDKNINPSYISTPRIGIDYAGEYWKKKPWRFLLNDCP